MDDKKRLQYLEAAKSLGYNTDNLADVENLITAIKYCELRFSDRRITDRDICDRINITMNMLISLKRSDAIKVATRILLTDFLDDSTRNDIRAQLFQIYQNDLVRSLRNLASIASGDVMGHNDEGAPIRASFREQVAAATVMLNNPLANAFYATTFAGEQGSTEEAEQLALRQKMLGQAKVLRLDDAVDAVTVEAKPSEQAA